MWAKLTYRGEEINGQYKAIVNFQNMSGHGPTLT